VVEAVVEDPATDALETASPEPGAPLEIAEVKAAIEPQSEPAPEPEVTITAAVEPKPAPEPEVTITAAVEPKPEPASVREEDSPRPVLAGDDAAVPYAIGDLAPDEAIAMPEVTVAITNPEQTPPAPPQPEEPVPDEAVAMLEEAPEAVSPLPEPPAEPLIDLAKVPQASPETPDPPIVLAYARPTDGAVDRPRIAVVVTGLGLGRAATEAAIRLPGAITLAFASHARDLQKWIDLARSAGHEVLLDLPMEPENYPAIDPGPHALLTSLSAAENVERLKWHLNRASGYVGVTHNMGSRFTASEDNMRPILSALKVRGLMFLDSRTSANSIAASLATTIGLPRAISNRFLDDQASRPAIGRRLDEIERIARRVGVSVAVSHAYPVTIERLSRWIKTLEAKKLSLVPVSALVNQQQIE
jgi:polysaccharide deacetylase 2 family uncharacterized protein YibQ